MPSVVGLLEQHEVAARRRVDGLREEADRIHAELAEAEQEWQEWSVARRRVDAVLAPCGNDDADASRKSQDAVKPNRRSWIHLRLEPPSATYPDRE